MQVARAYDFSAVAPSGQTLYYRFSGTGVEVTYPANNIPSLGWTSHVKPTGTLVIPSTVSHNDTNYAVVAVGGNAFYGCSDIASVQVGEGITAVRSSAFYNCTGLRKVSLPSTTDTVALTSFAHCTNMDTFEVRSVTPPVSFASAFNDVPCSTAVLRVACGRAAAYRAVQPWNGFANIVDSLCGVNIVVLANHANRGTVSGGGTYTEGTLVQIGAMASRGCFFACWNDGDTLAARYVTAMSDAVYTAHFFALQHDTLVVTDTIHATDTIYMGDSAAGVWRTLEVASSDPWRGIVAGNAHVPEGTIIEVAAIALGGNRFETWDDGVADNPRRVVVDADRRMVARFVPLASAAQACEPAWLVSVSGRQATVDCPQGSNVRIYDMQGHKLCDVTAIQQKTTVMLPTAGSYVVQVNGGTGRKIVVK